MTGLHKQQIFLYISGGSKAQQVQCNVSAQNLQENKELTKGAEEINIVPAELLVDSSAPVLALVAAEAEGGANSIGIKLSSLSNAAARPVGPAASSDRSRSFCRPLVVFVGKLNLFVRPLPAAEGLAREMHAYGVGGSQQQQAFGRLEWASRGGLLTEINIGSHEECQRGPSWPEVGLGPERSSRARVRYRSPFESRSL